MLGRLGAEPESRSGKFGNLAPNLWATVGSPPTISDAHIPSSGTLASCRATSRKRRNA
jgi:hypothetical protein